MKGRFSVVRSSPQLVLLLLGAVSLYNNQAQADERTEPVSDPASTVASSPFAMQAAPQPPAQQLAEAETSAVPNSPTAAPAAAKPKVKSPWKFGLAIAPMYVYHNWDKTFNGHGKVNWGFLKGDIDYDDGPFQASAEYRWYDYRNPEDHAFIQTRGGHPTSFIQHAWVGYKWTPNDQVQAGVTQVPFGILPYASNSHFAQLTYYLGLEDTWDTGVKYIHKQGPWEFDAAYFNRPAPNGHGTSENSARYSFNVVPEGSDRNAERNQVNGRIAYTFKHGKNASTEIGASVMAGQLHNEITGQDGSRHAYALHLNGTYGRWNTMLEVARYAFNPKDPAGQDARVVTMGGFDYPYLVAAKGTVYDAALSYTLPITNNRLVKSVTFYNDYSLLSKDEAAFRDTRQNDTGLYFKLGKVFTQVDFAVAKHQPYLGPDFTNGLASGSGDDHWNKTVNVKMIIPF